MPSSDTYSSMDVAETGASAVNEAAETRDGESPVVVDTFNMHQNSKKADERQSEAGTTNSLWKLLSTPWGLVMPFAERGLEEERAYQLQRIDDHPRGYPKLAAFINCSGNFMVCRKFGYLRSRILPYRQDELAELERTLLEYDQEDATTDDDSRLALMSRKVDDAREEDPAISRKTLIERINSKLKDYDDVVSRIQAYAKLSAPRHRDWNSFVAWMGNINPLTAEEQRFVEQQHDIVALVDGQEYGWLDQASEHALQHWVPRSVRESLLKSTNDKLKSDDPAVQLLSQRRTNVFVRIVLTMSTVGLIVGPSSLLFLVKGHGKLKILFIMVFVLLFSLVMSLFTRAKRHEMLAATATYAAVLVVFLGNFD